MNEPVKHIASVSNLKVYFGPPGRPLRALDGVNLDIEYGECVGLVGESGCGKSTLGRAMLRLEDPLEGDVFFHDHNIRTLKNEKLQHFREQAQMVFQDPFGSLNPRLTIGNAIDEVLHVHHYGRRRERRQRISELLESVGLDPAFAERYPHEFSGGQRQRIGIARALALHPRLIIADEPVSALDVSVQVQILNLLKDLQKRNHLSLLFIAHDLAVVRYMCKRIYIMYLGKIVETGNADLIYQKPAHPYTQALLSAIPDVDKCLQDTKKKRIVLQGDVPSPVDIIPGCPFHQRCHRAQPVCRVDVPILRTLPDGRKAACHFALDLLSE